jgi:hypothetical protein
VSALSSRGTVLGTVDICTVSKVQLVCSLLIKCLNLYNTVIFDVLSWSIAQASAVIELLALTLLLACL